MEGFRSGTSYAPGFQIGGPLVGFSVAQVVASKHAKHKAGDYVWGTLPWATYSILSAPDALIWLNITDFPKELHHNFLHTLGMPGLTGFHYNILIFSVLWIVDRGYPKRRRNTSDQ